MKLDDNLYWLAIMILDDVLAMDSEEPSDIISKVEEAFFILKASEDCETTKEM